MIELIIVILIIIVIIAVIASTKKEINKVSSQERKEDMNYRSILRERYINQVPMVGMSRDQAIQTCWGEPTSVDREIKWWGEIDEHWTYNNPHHHLYIQDGVVKKVEMK